MLRRLALTLAGLGGFSALVQAQDGAATSDSPPAAHLRASCSTASWNRYANGNGSFYHLSRPTPGDAAPAAAPPLHGRCPLSTVNDGGRP